MSKATSKPADVVKVKLLSARAGHSYDDAGRFTGVFSQAAGDVVDMSPVEAQRHIERGLAIPHAVEAK